MRLVVCENQQGGRTWNIKTLLFFSVTASHFSTVFGSDETNQFVLYLQVSSGLLTKIWKVPVVDVWNIDEPFGDDICIDLVQRGCLFSRYILFEDSLLTDPEHGTGDHRSEPIPERHSLYP